MAILRPDATTTLNGVKINEYLLTKHNPNHIDMPSVSMAGKIIGVTVHNTDWITVASGTTPAEQYTRATVNNNMKDVRVHYYVDNICAWQNLPHSLSGWHAADGSGNGNRRTIAIECIMSSAYNSVDKKSEDNAAKLAAALLKQYGLDINHLYTHTHWLNVRDGRNGTIDRVRKSWADAKSQLGAYSSLENAKKACKTGYSVFDANGNAVYINGGKFTKGQKVHIRANTPLFASAETTSVTRRISGTYYLYDGISCKNGRYRITTKPEFCGKAPVGRFVTGYVSWDNFNQ